MIRDKRKDEKYFNDFIDYQKKRIGKKEEKLKTISSDIEKEKRINLSLLNYKIGLLIAEYSAGENNKKLSETLCSTIGTGIKAGKIDYENISIILSFSVLLNDCKEIEGFISSYKKVINSDKLLSCLSNYIQNKNCKWEGSFLISSVYNDLENLSKEDEKEKVLRKYLTNWYKKHEGASWFETDKSGNDTYFGYWSFETAALAKIYGIDTVDLKDSPYYPEF